MRSSHTSSVSPAPRQDTGAKPGPNWSGYISTALLLAAGWLMVHSYAELPPVDTGADPMSSLQNGKGLGLPQLESDSAARVLSDDG